MPPSYCPVAMSARSVAEPRGPRNDPDAGERGRRGLCLLHSGGSGPYRRADFPDHRGLRRRRRSGRYRVLGCQSGDRTERRATSRRRRTAPVGPQLPGVRLVLEQRCDQEMQPDRGRGQPAQLDAGQHRFRGDHARSGTRSADSVWGHARSGRISCSRASARVSPAARCRPPRPPTAARAHRDDARQVPLAHRCILAPASVPAYPRS